MTCSYAWAIRAKGSYARFTSCTGYPGAHSLVRAQGIVNPQTNKMVAKRNERLLHGERRSPRINSSFSPLVVEFARTCLSGRNTSVTEISEISKKALFGWKKPIQQMAGMIQVPPTMLKVQKEGRTISGELRLSRPAQWRNS